VCPGHDISTYYFSCSGGSGVVSIKAHWDTLATHKISISDANMSSKCIN
jgi:hypothetical protein